MDAAERLELLLTQRAAEAMEILRPSSSPHASPSKSTLLANISTDLKDLDDFVAGLPSRSPNRKPLRRPSSSSSTTEEPSSSFRSSKEMRSEFLDKLQAVGVQRNVIVHISPKAASPKTASPKTVELIDDASNKHIEDSNGKEKETKIIEMFGDIEEEMRILSLQNQSQDVGSSAKTSVDTTEVSSTGISKPRDVQALSRARRHNLMRLKMKRSAANKNTLPTTTEETEEQMGIEDSEEEEECEDKRNDTIDVNDKDAINTQEELLMTQLQEVQSEMKQKEMLVQMSLQRENEKDSYTFLTGVKEEIEELDAYEGGQEDVTATRTEDDLFSTNNNETTVTTSADDIGTENDEDDLNWLNCRKLFMVIHPTGARVRRTPDVQSPGVAILQPGTVFESDEERVNSAGILVVRLATGGWVHTMYSAANGRIIQEVSTDGKFKEQIIGNETKAIRKKSNSEPNVVKENVKEKLLEKAKKSVLWKREKKDTAFYEMDMQSRQEVWMNRRAEKAERLEQRKIMEMKQQMPRIPDLTKTKDSWIRAKKMHEEQLIKARLDIELKHQRVIETQQKRRMKLSERVQELRRLSKLNEGINIGDDSVTSSCDIDELIEEGSVGKIMKMIKKSKKKKVKKVSNTPEKQIEYSSSALELLGEHMKGSEDERAEPQCESEVRHDSEVQLESEAVVLRHIRTNSAPALRAPSSAQSAVKLLQRGKSAKASVG